MNPTKKRLERKLGIIKILSKNPGITIERLSQFMGRTKQEIHKDLGELFMVGAYPYTPADYIEIDYNGNQIHMNLPVSIEKTIGLNIQEWLSLRQLIDTELELTKSPEELALLHSIKEKIRKIVPYAEYSDFHHLKEKIHQAISKKKRIQFLYLGRKDSDPEKRFVDPWFIFEEKILYLAAYCHSKKGIRTFRLESISEIIVTDTDIEFVAGQGDSEQYLKSFREFLGKSQQDADEAIILLQKGAYFNFFRQIEFTVLDEKFIFQGKEYLKVKCKVNHEGWFLEIVKSFGESCVVFAPDRLREIMKAELNQIFVPEKLDVVTS